MNKKTNIRLLLELFGVTFRIGAFTFGGGYAMIPLMQREFVEKRNWVDEKDIVDIFAIAQSVPGVIAINSSIFIGYKIAGFLGAISAALGVVLPSFIVLSVLSFYYIQFQSNPYVNGALRGVRAAVVALMISAVIKLGKPSVKDLNGWILAIGAFLITVIFDIHAILLIFAGGIIGWLLKRRKKV